jgi:hypothetical protein
MINSHHTDKEFIKNTKIYLTLSVPEVQLLITNCSDELLRNKLISILDLNMDIYRRSILYNSKKELDNDIESINPGC